MAGGTSNTAELIQQKGLTTALIYGSWQNWTIAIVTLVAVMKNAKIRGTNVRMEKASGKKYD